MIRLCAFSDEASPSLSGQIAALKRNGIDLTELRGVDGKNVADLSDADARRIRNELDACGISVWSLGSPYGKVRLGEGFDREALFSRLHRLCTLAGIFGTDKIRMFSFYCSDGRRGEVIDLLRESVNVAASYGVTLYHENEKDIYGDTVQRVLDLYEHVPGMRFVYDPANFIQCGVKAAESLPALAGLCGYYHIKDVIADTGEIVPAGFGDGDIASLIRSVKGDAVLTVEPHLKVFAGYSQFDGRELKNRFTFSDGAEAFEYAVASLKKLLIRSGYEIGGKNVWKPV